MKEKKLSQPLRERYIMIEPKGVEMFKTEYCKIQEIVSEKFQANRTKRKHNYYRYDD